jgi:hypothetical protein
MAKRKYFIEDGQKPCSKCKVTKPFSEFCADKHSRLGITPSCNECRNYYSAKNSKKQYIKHKDKRLSEAKLYYLKNSTAAAKRKKEWYEKNKNTKVLNAKLVKQFGITLEIYNEMRESQGYRCAMCLRDESCFIVKNPNFRLVVDHCHFTGKVRGLLCPTCNCGIGFLHESVEVLEAAIAYIQKHESRLGLEVQVSQRDQMIAESKGFRC